jgi:hypothetical protein
MEIPAQIRNLYRHWEQHVSSPGFSKAEPELPEKLEYFVHERISIWKKKTRLEPRPYTADPILREYRFCNIFREFDKQTMEFHALLNPLRDDFPLWLLNMFYCRMVAHPETIKQAGLLSFDEIENEKFYERLVSLPRPKFGVLYVFPISMILKSKTPDRETFIAFYLPKVMKTITEEISSWNRISVCEGIEKILPLFGYNLHFLWTEVLIDTAYQFPHLVDLYKQFPIGPGARPTFEKLAPGKDASVLVSELSSLYFPVGLTVQGKELRLSAENWEGIGCEYRKYCNLLSGKGRRRIYAP